LPMVLVRSAEPVARTAEDPGTRLPRDSVHESAWVAPADVTAVLLAARSAPLW
jgi:hypothetical protein